MQNNKQVNWPVSVIIPTMWRKKDYLAKMLVKYEASPYVGEVLIIDNEPENALPHLDKIPNLPDDLEGVQKQTPPKVIRKIYSGKNIYVNPAWNMGYREAKGEFLLIANDDIFIENLDDVLEYVIQRLGKGEIAGLNKIEEKNSDPIGLTYYKKTHQQFFRNWGSFMILRKDDYLPIPDDYKVCTGDWWLWSANQAMIIEGVQGVNAGSVTVNTEFAVGSIGYRAEDAHFARHYLPGKRILHLIMSCNRPEYLMRSLHSVSTFLGGSEHKVHRVLVDDYPKGRDDQLFAQLARTYDVDELILNRENKGLSVVWTELYERYKNAGFDYVLHQEDDVVLLEKVTVNSLIQALSSFDKACSVILARQPWYPRDRTCAPKPDDVWIGNFRAEKQESVFSPMFSFYPARIMTTDYKTTYGYNLNEGLIMQHLEKTGQHTVLLKNEHGINLIEHIGEYNQGRIILEGEPNWHSFAYQDPEGRRCSRTGRPL